MTNDLTMTFKATARSDVIRKPPWKESGIPPGWGGGGGTSIYGLCRYVPRDRVRFLRLSILK